MTQCAEVAPPTGSSALACVAEYSWGNLHEEGGLGVGVKGLRLRYAPIALHCIALHCFVLHCTALLCIELHCIALRRITLHCIALHCIALRVADAVVATLAELYCLSTHSIEFDLFTLNLF